MVAGYGCRIAVVLSIDLCVAASVQAQTTKTVLPLISGASHSVPDGSSFSIAKSILNSPGVIYHVTMALTLSHETPPDFDIEVSGPNGSRNVIVVSDVGSSGLPWVARRFVIDDCARLTLDAAELPPGSYRPTNSDDPATPTLTDAQHSLSVFNGLSADGSWEVTFRDDRANGSGGTVTDVSLIVYTEPAGLGRNSVPCATPDYDGDGRADVSIYRPETGEWFIQKSGENGALLHRNWGAPSSVDLAVSADYDGDGVTDVAVYRLATGEWWIVNSFDGSITQTVWGAPSHLGTMDKPVPSDYDGDGRADLAIYRSSSGQWFIRNSTDDSVKSISWGNPPTGDYPAR